jgi:YfiH family protein
VIRFKELEKLGVRVAVCSGVEDGDCGWNGSGTAQSGRCVIANQCGFPETDYVCGLQVHGVQVTVVGETDRGKGALKHATAIPDNDALITITPGLPLAVFAADCVPVYLFDPGILAIGLVHAGRVGTFEGIAVKTIEAMVEHMAVRPDHIHAVIGPSAGPARYEVSEELAEGWKAKGLPAEGRYLNLWDANRLQLESAGVPGSHIQICGHCTMSDSRYFSYRRNGTAERNMAVLML